MRKREDFALNAAIVVTGNQTFSLGTMVLQWGIVFVVMLLLNNLFTRKINRASLSDDDRMSINHTA